MNLKAYVKKTDNSYVTNLYIEEEITEENADGYVQIKGEITTHQLVIEGHNSYRRAKALAERINNPCQK